MATRNGARTLGLEHEIGSIQVGRRADLILIDTDAPHLQPQPDPYSTIVYAARAGDVRLTMVDGEILVDDSELTRMDRGAIVAAARAEAAALAARAGM
jgi:5-methylthioadenosine/S-adenosylhomocysteine deaminase